MLLAVFLFRRSALGISQQLLHLLKGLAVDDGLMDIFEDYPVFLRIVPASLVLEGLGIGLKVDDISAVFLLRKDLGNGGLAPLVRILLGFLAATADALRLQISGGVKYLSLLQDTGDGFIAISG